MTSEQIKSLLEKQRAYYRSGVTVSVKFRIEQLKKLYLTVEKYQNEINDALRADLGKSHYEGFMCESGLALTEISYMIKHVNRFSKRKIVYTPCQSCYRTAGKRGSHHPGTDGSAPPA